MVSTVDPYHHRIGYGDSLEDSLYPEKGRVLDIAVTEATELYSAERATWIARALIRWRPGKEGPGSRLKPEFRWSEA